LPTGSIWSRSTTPGSGNTELPDPADWEYTFDHLAEIVDETLLAIDFTGPMGLYMQDHGGSVGNRLISLHRDWFRWQIIQNANIYEEGLTELWDGLRNGLWAGRSTEPPIDVLLEPETCRPSISPAIPIRRKSARTTGTSTCTS
jgi:hypothetical protein